MILIKENITEFTEEQRKKLIKAWKDKKIVTIKGVNRYGESFTTQARLASTDDGEKVCIASNKRTLKRKPFEASDGLNI